VCVSVCVYVSVLNLHCHLSLCVPNLQKCVTVDLCADDWVSVDIVCACLHEHAGNVCVWGVYVCVCMCMCACVCVHVCWKWEGCRRGGVFVHVCACVHVRVLEIGVEMLTAEEVSREEEKGS
jgi:hypothetical protein